jgi:hypothetical protein
MFSKVRIVQSDRRAAEPLRAPVGRGRQSRNKSITKTAFLRPVGNRILEEGHGVERTKRAKSIQHSQSVGLSRLPRTALNRHRLTGPVQLRQAGKPDLLICLPVNVMATMDAFEVDPVTSG